MIDIWGRPLSGAEKPSGETRALDSINDVKKIIEDEIAETLNLASVDPGEIVVFQDKQGKLKSSNVSIDDLLIRRRDAADNSVAVFEHGKLKPGVLVSTITDTLANYDKEFDEHVKNYNTFRKNIVHKFFGTPITAIPSLAEIKTFIDDQKKKFDEITLLGWQLETVNKDVSTIKGDQKEKFDEITLLGRQLEAVNKDVSTIKDDQKTKFDEITLLGRQLEAINKDVSTIKDDQKTKFDEIKTSIDDQKTKFTDSQKDHAGVISDIGQQLLNINLNVIPRLEKVKIPHPKEAISNIVYTRKPGSLEWTPNNNVILVSSTVKGIHRLTLVSQTQFNISSLGSYGTNNVISTIIEKDATVQFIITSPDANLKNASLTWYVEFVAELN